MLRAWSTCWGSLTALLRDSMSHWYVCMNLFAHVVKMWCAACLKHLLRVFNCTASGQYASSVCMHVCICGYMHACTLYYMYMRMCKSMYIYICMCTCMCVRVCMCMRMRMFMCICMCMCMCVYVCMYVYIYIYTWLHTHKQTNKHRHIHLYVHTGIHTCIHTYRRELQVTKDNSDACKHINIHV